MVVVLPRSRSANCAVMKPSANTDTVKTANKILPRRRHRRSISWQDMPRPPGELSIGDFSRLLWEGSGGDLLSRGWALGPIVGFHADLLVHAPLMLRLSGLDARFFGAPVGIRAGGCDAAIAADAVGAAVVRRDRERVDKSRVVEGGNGIVRLGVELALPNRRAMVEFDVALDQHHTGVSAASILSFQDSATRA